ncbi:hypothetical protein LZ31DRAFT_636857 [Colletotrichum somersetense]|nr:hypothetical protein LZ31DRAFT_636857 [Colletotrichum somersetense]
MASFQAVNKSTVAWVDPSSIRAPNIWVEARVNELKKECKDTVVEFKPTNPDAAIKNPMESRWALSTNAKPLEGLPDPTTGPMTPTKPANCPRPSDQGRVAAPPWLPPNSTIANEILHTRWAEGFAPNGSWGRWNKWDADEYLKGIYNACGTLIRHEWLATDEVEALVHNGRPRPANTQAEEGGIASGSKVKIFIGDKRPHRTWYYAGDDTYADQTVNSRISYA